MERQTLEDAMSRLEGFAYWSSNFSFPTPFTLFVDIIGYTEDRYGEKLLSKKSYDEVVDKMGYVELGKLGEALIAYATYPVDSLEWIDEYEGSSTK